MTKFIFVTGGVVSSLGKGINAASIGQVLKARGLKVFIQKFDPYINVDPGTMSPYQHGEVFITEDGAETDLDLGHYERFIDENLSSASSVSTGKIYSSVIEKERKGLYDGATIQVIPHITDEIKGKLLEAAESSGADIVITEIGGTVGDIESLPYLEAIRQARRDFGYHNTLFMHNTLVPYIAAAKEIKTKPTQHSIRELKSLGIQPDILMLRSERKISESAMEKIALFSDLDRDAIFESLDVKILFEPILLMKEQKIDDFILDHFMLEGLPEANLTEWEDLIENIKILKDKVKVGIVGKYVSHHDAYLSLVESLKYSGYKYHVIPEIKWIDAGELTLLNVSEQLKDLDGVIIPGGFGKRATEGKIKAIKYARETGLPLLGICYGMQLSLIEYARNVLNIDTANSTEIDNFTESPVVTNNPNNKTHLGSKKVRINSKTKLKDIYGKSSINERFRHSYSFNDKYEDVFLKDENIIFSSYDEYGMLSAIELKNHPWFISVQYHPEFLSRPLRSHKLFDSFIEALKNRK